MKKILGFGLVLFLWTNYMIAQSNGKVCTPPTPINLEDAVGHWEGLYQFNEKTYPFAVDVALNNGKLVVATSLPEFNVSLTTFKTRVCGAKEIHFSHITSENHRIEFIGKPQNGQWRGDLRYQVDPNVCQKAQYRFSLTQKSLKLDKRLQASIFQN